MPSLEASLRNLEKARAAWSHSPRPWRSFNESCVIEQLVWQWFNAGEMRKWSGRAVARWLGISHTYVQKLARKFEADSDKMRRIQAGVGPATLMQLSRAQEESRRQKERGWLREPRRWKVAEFKIGDQVVRTLVPTKAEERRKAAKANAPVLGVRSVPQDVPPWAMGMSYCPMANTPNPLVAVNRAIQQSSGPRPVRFFRRWRPGHTYF